MSQSLESFTWLDTSNIIEPQPDTESGIKDQMSCVITNCGARSVGILLYRY